MRINVGDKRLCLTLKERVRKDGKVCFLCQCDCGNIKTIAPQKFGDTATCGCRLTACGENNPNWRGHKGLQSSLWCGYVRNAKKRNISFNLSIEEGWNIFQSQHGVCAISGVEIVLGRRHRTVTTASLDRIDNAKGYSVDNVHWVHKKINQIKMDMKLEEFISWCRKVTNAN